MVIAATSFVGLTQFVAIVFDAADDRISDCVDPGETRDLGALHRHRHGSEIVAQGVALRRVICLLASRGFRTFRALYDIIRKRPKPRWRDQESKLAEGGRRVRQTTEGGRFSTPPNRPSPGNIEDLTDRPVSRPQRTWRLRLVLAGRCWSIVLIDPERSAILSKADVKEPQRPHRAWNLDSSTRNRSITGRDCGCLARSTDSRGSYKRS